MFDTVHMNTEAESAAKEYSQKPVFQKANENIEGTVYDTYTSVRT
jgi:hypothetical protein